MAFIIKGFHVFYSWHMNNRDSSTNGQYSQLSPILVTDKYFNVDWLVSNQSTTETMDVFWGMGSHTPKSEFYHAMEYVSIGGGVVLVASTQVG